MPAHSGLLASTVKESNYVVKSNALVEASYRLSLMEQRIILGCISKIKMGETITDQKQYSVFVKDLAEMTDIHSGTLYTDFSKAIIRLKRREIWVREQPNGQGKHGAGFEIVSWIQYARYIPKLGEARIRFSHDIIPYINQLSSHFTRYSLDDVSKMTSIYAVRLYELLVQWGSVGHRNIEIDFLRDSFSLESRYKLIADFRRFVIEPAVEQINEHSPMKVSYEFTKTGRKLTHIIFHFDAKESLVISTAKEKPKPKSKTKPQPGPKPAAELSEYELSKLARPGESLDQLKARLRNEKQKQQKLFE